MRQSRPPKKVATLQETQEEFEGIDEQLRNHELPVIDRPKAVLALWDLFDRLQERSALQIPANKK